MADIKKKKNKAFGYALVALALLGSTALLVWASLGRSLPVLQPKGIIAQHEFTLIAITVGLGVLIVLPVFILLFGIAWKYRATNKKAQYQPEFSSHKGFEALWWGIPILIIIVLAVLTAFSTHALDPKKSIQSSQPPLKIQVVALQWRWLFIYPEEKIATINTITVPKDRPIEFTLTSDAPMNSFWVPALGGQIYAMSGMSPKLHLMASELGSYRGVSANISGDGFSDMQFTVTAVTAAEYEGWVQQFKPTESPLTMDSYAKLAMPTHDTQQRTYRLEAQGLYDEIIMKYMHHDKDGSHQHHE